MVSGCCSTGARQLSLLTNNTAGQRRYCAERIRRSFENYHDGCTACLFFNWGKPKNRTGGKAVFITDAYVPSGAHQFTVADGRNFSAGDEIAISKPVTDSWVHFMGMDALVRDGKEQTWITGELTTERTIRAVKIMSS